MKKIKRMGMAASRPQEFRESDFFYS